MSTAQIAVLTTAQTYALTTSQIVAFTTDQIPGLGTANIVSMTMTQISAFEAEDVAVMSVAQLDAMFLATPIMLDLSGAGINTLAAAEGVHFDVTGTGNANTKWGWAGEGTGLLVRDRNHDGVINDGTELYGVGTKTANGSRAGDGYVAMALEDSNHDGKLNAQDRDWKEMQVWVDANRDGKTDAGELKAMDELGIVELDLAAQKGSDVDNGNLLGLVSSYTKSDGSQHLMADVWVAKDTAPAGEATVSLGELLAAPSSDLLAPAGGGAAPAHGTPAASQAMTHAVIDRRLQDDELNRPLPLI